MLSPERLERLRGQIDAGRRRLDTARSRAGRIATAAGTVAATAGLFTPVATGESLLATALATGAGLVFLPTGRAARRAAAAAEGKAPEPHHQAKTATVLYAAPGVALVGVLIAERIVPGVHWGEGLAVAVWSAGTFYLRPSRTARHMLVPPLPPLEKTGDLVVAAQPAYDHPAAQWWAERAAVEGGAAPGTALEDIERIGESAMRAVIRSTVPGEPVPDISVRRLSALMDVPEDLIAVGPVPGRGASVRQLSVGTADEALDARTLWATRIAPLAMPGASITAINFGSMTTAPVTMTKEIDA
ncbi:hypothetical protein [Streptomyces rubrogriseus]|uniref:Uncharacterized protein n=2 Tax=Streptomyces rubrogriseus TaxID=194673 RepID=A0A6G3TU69_9ACTN|nr:hypothetical protein [Streptomyces rubrogriseus]NEC40133.1 hypothetical protein [Streptomyces rubrogriseus]